MCSPLTIQGFTPAEDVSVTHAASPLSALRSIGMATDESATDAEFLKLANRDAAAPLRSLSSTRMIALSTFLHPYMYQTKLLLGL